jgi:hypothetical protein
VGQIIRPYSVLRPPNQAGILGEQRPPSSAYKLASLLSASIRLSLSIRLSAVASGVSPQAAAPLFR